MDLPIEAWTRGKGLPKNLGPGEMIPTWQHGMDQQNPYDMRRYIEHGYGENSLVYSCITETATAFAPLRAQLVRKGSASAPVRDHPAIHLLNEPNAEQDANEFQELIATQYEAAGNVYIHMNPLSASPERRERFRGYPVQDLQAIRPDYVSIKPGRSRAEDTFVVTIEGRVRAEIPRAQIIHIHEPKITNDFYGFPKLAVLVREVNIDLQMSDFELAFYRNAGVPMGILSVKGVKKEEAGEIKSNFRKAYNGFRKWFDLLVLNAEEATYQQLGMKQTDMAGDSARGLVESRICAVFGVPGVIVGAKFAMAQGIAEQNREEAQHAFWAEKMVPFSGRFASAWTKHLLPQFGTREDRGAHIEYDTTTVRALQEDRSRKLREAVRLINTGGFTVNQALTLVGLPAVENGDFYVRTGNQVTIAADGTSIILNPSGDGDQEPNPPEPFEGAA